MSAFTVIVNVSISTFSCCSLINVLLSLFRIRVMFQLPPTTQGCHNQCLHQPILLVLLVHLSRRKRHRLRHQYAEMDTCGTLQIRVLVWPVVTYAHRPTLRHYQLRQDRLVSLALNLFCLQSFHQNLARPTARKLHLVINGDCKTRYLGTQPFFGFEKSQTDFWFLASHSWFNMHALSVPLTIVTPPPLGWHNVLSPATRMTLWLPTTGLRVLYLTKFCSMWWRATLNIKHCCKVFTLKTQLSSIVCYYIVLLSVWSL